MRVRLNKDEPCKHMFTDKEGRCIDCGDHIWAMETRPCGECECFHEKPYKGWPKCGKHILGVVKELYIRYAVKDGTCFEVGHIIAKPMKKDDGVLVVTETRPCMDCKSYLPNKKKWPRCKRKVMTVTHDMYAYYYTDNGTCFESKEDIK